MPSGTSKCWRRSLMTTSSPTRMSKCPVNVVHRSAENSLISLSACNPCPLFKNVFPFFTGSSCISTRNSVYITGALLSSLSILYKISYMCVFCWLFYISLLAGYMLLHLPPLFFLLRCNMYRVRSCAYTQAVI